MSHTIIIDTERKIAALVNDDPMYGLGPAISADEPEEAVEALVAFVDALEDPPETMPTIRLMTEWSAFIMALAGHIAPPQETAAEAPLDGASPAPAPAEDPEAQRVLAEQQEAAEAARQEAGGAPAPEPAGELGGTGGPPPLPDEEPEPDEDPEAAAEVSERIAAAPGTPAKTGQQECWACLGEGKVDIGGTLQDCNVCQGTGRVKSATPA